MLLPENDSDIAKQVMDQNPPCGWRVAGLLEFDKPIGGAGSEMNPKFDWSHVSRAFLCIASLLLFLQRPYLGRGCLVAGTACRTRNEG